MIRNADSIVVPHVRASFHQGNGALEKQRTLLLLGHICRRLVDRYDSQFVCRPLSGLCCLLNRT